MPTANRNLQPKTPVLFLNKPVSATPTGKDDEFAERIYQKVKFKWIYTTLTSWQTSSKSEDRRRIERRDVAVSTVHGSDSLQMGDRTFRLLPAISLLKIVGFDSFNLKGDAV
jgi:hypothetical protein